MKLWGLVAVVAPTAHITQQSFSKIEFFIGQNDVIDISFLYNLSLQEFYYAYPLHIYKYHTAHIFVEESSSIQYWR